MTYIFARVSSEAQAESNSLNAQFYSMKCRIDELHWDQNVKQVSIVKPANEEIDSQIQKCINYKNQYIMFDSADRFSRIAVNAIELINKLIRRGNTLHFVAENYTITKKHYPIRITRNKIIEDPRLMFQAIEYNSLIQTRSIKRTYNFTKKRSTNSIIINYKKRTIRDADITQTDNKRKTKLIFNKHTP